jgi:tetratricopeptide (TPR) repeat protein
MTFPRECLTVLTVIVRQQARVLAAVCLLAVGVAPAPGQTNSLVQRRWFEARTTHFHTYSCGATQEVSRLAARLEQFHGAYAVLAGSQAVVSPPIVVLAFPDHATLEPFLPVYQGKPANLAGFFKRNSDENLIVLSLAHNGPGSLETIFHEYTHLLLRHNERFWPLWLKEGMADIYATFEVTGEERVRIGQPMAPYLRLLAQRPLMPLAELFAVAQDSPQYNEQERQGVFYAQSWLLTHYLMLGGNATRKAQLGQLTALLRQGQSPEAAFTNAFRTPLPVMEKELRGYLERGKFEPLALAVRTSLYAPQALALRSLRPAETCFRLGDELLRIGRAEAAESYFVRAQKLAPGSPLPFEGLGLLAAEHNDHAEAARHLHDAIAHGSTSFLAHYIYAREKLQLTAHAPDTYGRLDKETAAEIRPELEKSLALMPDFGPAHHLLGFFELLQGEAIGTAEQHLQRAIQLEPENQAYVLTLAEAQLFSHDPESARRTLEPLRRPYVDAQVRTRAEEMLKEAEASKGKEANR